MKKGIDISQWQGNIDINKVKASGVEFIILRAGYGRLVTQKDEQFYNNYSKCKSVGIPCGAYWYSYATSESEAKQEAAVCLEILKGKQFEYPIYYDVEENKTLSLGKEKVSAIIKAFCSELEKAGYFVGLYMSASPLTNFVNEDVKSRYTIWVAHYGVSKPSYNGAYGMWQKSSVGKIDGISGNVDLDEVYEDYPTIIKSANLNGFKKEEPAKAKLKKEVKLVIDGQTYAGTLEEV